MESLELRLTRPQTLTEHRENCFFLEWLSTPVPLDELSINQLHGLWQYYVEEHLDLPQGQDNPYPGIHHATDTSLHRHDLVVDIRTEDPDRHNRLLGYLSYRGKVTLIHAAPWFAWIVKADALLKDEPEKTRERCIWSIVYTIAEHIRQIQAKGKLIFDLSSTLLLPAKLVVLRDSSFLAKWRNTMTPFDAYAHNPGLYPEIDAKLQWIQ